MTIKPGDRVRQVRSRIVPDSPLHPGLGTVRYIHPDDGLVVDGMPIEVVWDRGDAYLFYAVDELEVVV